MSIICPKKKLKRIFNLTYLVNIKEIEYNLSIYYHFISAKFVTPQQIQANSPLLQAEVKVEQIWSDDIDVTSVSSGENVKIKVKGIDDGEVSPGFVLCSLSNPIKTGKVFDAQVSFTSSIEKNLHEILYIFQILCFRL